ncbi:CYTH domain-containing protein [Rhizobium azibense]|nr:CYTH domain-containing protein [Rhizobium azibense]
MVVKTIEIERKFLVCNDSWRTSVVVSHTLQQGYLSRHRERSVRIRVIDGTSARLTVKFASRGLAREEYEYNIPVFEACELLRHVNGTVLEKTRYIVSHGDAIWEIDVYSGAYEGLTIAEIEMSNEHDVLALPGWLGREVTGDQKYSNRAMAARRCVTASPPVPHESIRSASRGQSSNWSLD